MAAEGSLPRLDFSCEGKKMMDMRTLGMTIMAGLALSVGLVGCGNLIEDCDPEFDEDCACTLDDDPGVDVTDDCINGETEDQEFCTCTIAGDLLDDDDDDATCGDGVCGDDESCAVDCGDSPSFRFVMVEDLTRNPSGDFPGADVDAISLIKRDGDELFAASLSSDTDVDCAGNRACDPSALLGPPDAIRGGKCFGGQLSQVDASTFTALNGGFAVVQFSDRSRDAKVENGDRLRVYEIGATQCGAFDDDPYRVSVSVSDDLGSFVEVGTGGRGVITIPVTGL